MTDVLTRDDDALRERASRLSLEQKVRLLTGADFWSTYAEPAVGLKRMVLSDGPSGVRGETWDERDPSLNLPSATALAATWDLRQAYRYGAALAAEAQRKGVHVVLGPTINLHRSPLGGRHFEAFSEDPLLTAQLAAAYVRGLQDHGVAATLKHYVANDAETDRFTADVIAEQRTLRELYLAAFETAVVEARAWAVMSAYNAVNGVTMTENPLLDEPLCGEWGFDGLVVSDWTAVRSTEPSARPRQDLAMPGPDSPWGDALVAAVRAGRVRKRRSMTRSCGCCVWPRESARSTTFRRPRASPREPMVRMGLRWRARFAPTAWSWSATPVSCRGPARPRDRSR